MITEDYVSFEIAKLLKEKGFDIPTIGRYSIRSKEFHLDCTRMCNNGGLFECAAPTHQMAMKWLREVHNIGIEPWYCDGKWECGFCTLPKGIDLYTSFEGTRYDTYEEAVETAIKYCLENLI